MSFEELLDLPNPSRNWLYKFPESAREQCAHLQQVGDPTFMLN